MPAAHVGSPLAGGLASQFPQISQQGLRVRRIGWRVDVADGRREEMADHCLRPKLMQEDIASHLAKSDVINGGLVQLDCDASEFECADHLRGESEGIRRA